RSPPMTRTIVEDVRDYRRRDLAAKYRSTAGTQPPADPAQLDALMGALDRDGYVIVENLIPVEEVEAIRADLMPRFAELTGRNNFEGFATRRLYALIEKTLICNPLVEHPLILGLLDRILSPTNCPPNRRPTRSCPARP